MKLKSEIDKKNSYNIYQNQMRIKASYSTGALLVMTVLSLLVVDSLALVQPSTVDDDGISPIWSDWVDENRELYSSTVFIHDEE